MAPDIALGEGAINRVTERMDADIGVRMAGEPLLMRNLDAAKNELAPGRESVDIEAGPDTGQPAWQRRMIFVQENRSPGAKLLSLCA